MIPAARRLGSAGFQRKVGRVAEEKPQGAVLIELAHKLAGDVYKVRLRPKFPQVADVAERARNIGALKEVGVKLLRGEGAICGSGDAHKVALHRCDVCHCDHPSPVAPLDDRLSQVHVPLMPFAWVGFPSAFFLAVWAPW